VLVDQRLQQAAPGLSEVAALDEDLAERFRLVQRPGVHPGDEGVAGDEVDLQREDAEEQVAVGVGLGHRCRPVGFRHAIRPRGGPKTIVSSG
jgi:hypothetical protein